MIRKICVVILLATLILSGCAGQNVSRDKYDEEWMIGKTRAEVEERYGAFDVFENGQSNGGQGVGRYILVPDRKTIFGDIDYGEHLRVYFDEAGIVYSIRVELNDFGG